MDIGLQGKADISTMCRPNTSMFSARRTTTAYINKTM